MAPGIGVGGTGKNGCRDFPSDCVGVCYSDSQAFLCFQAATEHKNATKLVVLVNESEEIQPDIIRLSQGSELTQSSNKIFGSR